MADKEAPSPPFPHGLTDKQLEGDYNNFIGVLKSSRRPRTTKRMPVKKKPPSQRQGILWCFHLPLPLPSNPHQVQQGLGEAVALSPVPSQKPETAVQTDVSELYNMWDWTPRHITQSWDGQKRCSSDLRLRKALESNWHCVGNMELQMSGTQIPTSRNQAAKALRKSRGWDS